MHQEMEKLRSVIPAGIELGLFYDQSNIVKASIGSVRDAIIIGLFLTGLIIWLFLRDLGTAVMAGLVVPVTICITFIALKIMGQSFNMMTLGGLAAAGGLVIDDAIVVVENIVLHRDGGEGPLEATSKALKELTIPLIGSTLTPIVVFLPLISITGVTGSFFRALAVAMSISLLTSLVLALGWTTNLGTLVIRRKKTPKKSQEIPATASVETSQADEMRRIIAAEEESMRGGVFERILTVYERWMRRALRHPAWLAALCIILVVLAYVCYINLGSDLLPAMDEGGFILDYVMPPGSSLQETNRVIDHVEKIIRAVPEVDSTSRRTGLQLGLAAVTEPNTGDISVKLKDKRSRDIDEIIAEIRTKVKTQEPALDVDFTQLLQDMIGDLTGAPQPIVVKLFSPDPQLLAAWAPRVADALGNVIVNNKKPIVDIQNGIDNTTSGPAVVFAVNPAAASQAGFTTDQLAIAASAIVDGEPATSAVVIDDRPYTMRVRFPEANRASLDAMSNTTLVNAAGGTATLGSLATVTEVPGQTEIRRENLQRDVEVTARLEGLDLGTGVAATQKAISGLNLPRSIRVEYGGTYQEQQKSFHDLVVVLVLALVLIFLVLLFRVWHFHSAHCDSVFRGAFEFRRVSGSADHADHLQCFVIHGIDHGGWYRSQKWHPTLGCKSQISLRRIRARRSVDTGRTTTPSADRYDGNGGRRGNGASLIGVGRRLADATTARDRRYRRHPHFDDLVVDCHARGAILPWPFCSRAHSGDIAMAFLFVYIANLGLHLPPDIQCEF